MKKMMYHLNYKGENTEKQADAAEAKEIYYSLPTPRQKQHFLSSFFSDGQSGKNLKFAVTFHNSMSADSKTEVVVTENFLYRTPSPTHTHCAKSGVLKTHAHSAPCSI